MIDIRFYNIMCVSADPYIVCLTYLIGLYELIKAPCGCNIMMLVKQTKESFSAFGAHGFSMTARPAAQHGTHIQGRRANHNQRKQGKPQASLLKHLCDAAQPRLQAA